MQAYAFGDGSEMEEARTLNGAYKVEKKTITDKSMDYDGRFIMQKTVDWSLLNDGMTIPVSVCAVLKLGTSPF